MRYSFLIIATILFFTACKKDKYTTAPQITFKSYKPANGSNRSTLANEPKLILEITDAEGDLGFNNGKDTSRIYIKNLLTNRIDSPFLPNLTSVAQKNFKADIEAGLFTVMGGRSSGTRPYSDTIQFEVYVKDFAKNKSNVLVTPKIFVFTSY